MSDVYSLCPMICAIGKAKQESGAVGRYGFVGMLGKTTCEPRL